jgi:hypothetical protein
MESQTQKEDQCDVKELSMRWPCESYCVRQPVSGIRAPRVCSKQLTSNKTNAVAVGAIGLFRRLTQL